MPKAAPFSYLLDTYSGATVAYSLRKLRTAYTGNCIRVRRSSDNTEQDIGFVNNVLDTASLLTFVGASNGFVTTWYDQSGNGNNVTQSTATAQPSIVTSGVIDLLSTGLPAVYFNSKQLITSVNFQFGDSSIFAVAKQMSGEVIAARLIDNNYQYGFWLGRATDGSNTIGGGWKQENPPYGVFPSIANNTKFLISAYRNGAVSNISLNNNAFSSITTLSGLTFSNPISIGAALGNTFNGIKYVSEIIIYPTNQSANVSGINGNINTYYSIY